MTEQRQILEQYLKMKFSDKPNLSILQLDKLADGWESDNYHLGVEYGVEQKSRHDWVWRIYSGSGNQEKAKREFTSMQKLHAAGYPVPQVYLVETGQTSVGRPFMVMEFIQGELLWDALRESSQERQLQLIDQFFQLFVRLHALDWKLFDPSLPGDEPYYFIDKWIHDAQQGSKNFPEMDASPFLDWVIARRDQLACARPSPAHLDFHPGNVLVREDGSAVVIDWTNFAVTDYRFDLAWMLVLVHAYTPPGMRDYFLQAYEQHAGAPVEQMEVFEAIACARRLFDLTVSLTFGAQRMGMNAQAAEIMRANMEPHRRVHELFVLRTGLHIQTFQDLFGKSE